MPDDYVQHEPVQPHTYTHLDPDHPEDDIVVCNDCGASAETEEEVVHYPTCKPGESQFWADQYDQGDDEWENEQTRLAELEDGRWDDDPNPYDGTLSEE